MGRKLVPEGRLLVYDVKDGWEPLCNFWAVEVPDREFSRLNERESMRGIYFGMQLLGACVWCSHAVRFAEVAWLALRPDIVKGLIARAAGWMPKVL
jgi:hypothetical protein